MNKKSIYREQITYYLNKDEDYAAILEWAEEQPDLDQPDILRELTTILKERHEKTGEMHWLEKANIIEEGIAQFEDDVLDEKLHKALFMMQFDNVEIDQEQILPFLIGARTVLINCFLLNPEDSKELSGIALKVIKVEKREGLYDPDNWNTIFPL